MIQVLNEAVIQKRIKEIAALHGWDEHDPATRRQAIMVLRDDFAKAHGRRPGLFPVQFAE